MNVVILGTAKESQIISNIIEKTYNSWLKKFFNKESLNVIGYVSYEDIDARVVDNKVILNLEQLAVLYHQKIINKIIFPREVYFLQRTILSFIRKIGVSIRDIWIAQRISDEISLQNFLEMYLSAKYLPYLEFHIADHCNLNCKACSHYSGLVKKAHFPDLEKFTRDFERFHKFIDDLGFIRILGGEPLLNPEISKYIKLSRRLYPQAVIRVVTNAILLPKMPESFFETLREFNAGIDISFYPPLESKMYTIQCLLKERKVDFSIGQLNRWFNIRQIINAHDNQKEIFLKCSNAHCHNLYEGKVATCPRTIFIKYFNDYYQKKLPTDGIIDLYDENLTTQKLKTHLLLPFELCRYCLSSPVKVEWRTIKNPSPITDWIID